MKKLRIKVGSGKYADEEANKGAYQGYVQRLKSHVLHEQSAPGMGVVVVEHPQEFYAVLQYVDMHTLNNGHVWWFRDVAGKDNYVWPLRDWAVHHTLLHVEPQGVGLFDGKWRIKRHGGYLSVEPVLLTQDAPEKPEPLTE